MKTIQAVTLVALVSVAGCGKQTDINSLSKTSAVNVKNQTNGQSSQAPQTAAPAASDQTQTFVLTSKAQSVIETARKFLADGKWAEALQTLNELAGLRLTPEQQSVVDTLKAEAQKIGQQPVTTRPAPKR